LTRPIRRIASSPSFLVCDGRLTVVASRNPEAAVALELSKALVEGGDADVGLRDADGFTALHWAAAVGLVLL
jgi:ankyrin repeat protein